MAACGKEIIADCNKPQKINIVLKLERKQKEECNEPKRCDPPPPQNCQTLPCGCVVVYENPCCNCCRPPPCCMARQQTCGGGGGGAGPVNEASSTIINKPKHRSGRKKRSKKVKPSSTNSCASQTAASSILPKPQPPQPITSTRAVTKKEISVQTSQFQGVGAAGGVTVSRQCRSIVSTVESPKKRESSRASRASKDKIKEPEVVESYRKSKDDDKQTEDKPMSEEPKPTRSSAGSRKSDTMKISSTPETPAATEAPESTSTPEADSKDISAQTYDKESPPAGGVTPSKKASLSGRKSSSKPDNSSGENDGDTTNSSMPKDASESISKSGSFTKRKSTTNNADGGIEPVEAIHPDDIKPDVPVLTLSKEFASVNRIVGEVEEGYDETKRVASENSRKSVDLGYADPKTTPPPIPDEVSKSLLSNSKSMHGLGQYNYIEDESEEVIEEECEEGDEEYEDEDDGECEECECEEEEECRVCSVDGGSPQGGNDQGELVTDGGEGGGAQSETQLEGDGGEAVLPKELGFWDSWQRFISVLQGEPYPDPCTHRCGGEPCTGDEPLPTVGEGQPGGFGGNSYGGGLLFREDPHNQDTMIILLALPLVLLGLMASFKGCNCGC